jgi:hypothetical protein
MESGERYGDFRHNKWEYNWDIIIIGKIVGMQ